MAKFRRLFAVLHLIILIGLIYWNYYTNTGAINGNTVGGVSDNFENLFTPASYAFAIWGVIYLGLLILGIYWIYLAFSKPRESVSIVQAAPSLIVAHFGNAVWLWFWLHEETGKALLVMFGILLALIITSLKIRKLVGHVKSIDKWLIHLPIGLYFGWISVATIANVASHLAGIGWTGGIGESMWATIAVAVATLLGIFMLLKRKNYVFACVVVWALIAIAVRHSQESIEVMWTAVVGVFSLIIAGISDQLKYKSNIEKR
ncbi:MAG: tryptophan-rich sensory protein [bacterium]|nr:tryptophan-rich sensory protein [bacterium]